MDAVATGVATVLGPLAESAHDRLLDGLAAFLTTGSATGAAARLHVHPRRCATGCAAAAS